ncbi:hypothetical protein GCM10010230_23980 [Streptomyces narbonensis]|nr:hypothetical protein GCM10010230_23980 [Streptomyces narbonensis]
MRGLAEPHHLRVPDRTAQRPEVSGRAGGSGGAEGVRYAFQGPHKGRLPAAWRDEADQGR